MCFSFIYADDFAKKYGYLTDYDLAVKKAKEEKKDIFFVLVSDHCPYCDRLKEEQLSLDYTVDILQRHYIPLMLNNNQYHYPSRFDSYVVPAVHFVSYKDESIIETVLGYNYYHRFYEIIEAKNEGREE